MHIAILADFAETNGGAAAVAIASAIGLAAAGLRVTYLQGIAGTADPRLAEAGIDVVPLGLSDVWHLPRANGIAAGIWNRRAAAELERALRTLPVPPDVIHLHQWTRALSPAIFPVLRAFGRPVVVTLHEYFLTCPNGVYYRFDKEEPCRLQPLSAACALAPCDPRSGLFKTVRLLRSVATRNVLRDPGFAVVHVSDRGRDTTAPFLPDGLPQYRVDNPVEAERGPPASISPGARIAYVGRLTREKGADLVAAAAAASGMSALFVGEGPAEADIRRLSPASEILGWRSRADLGRLLRHAVLAVAAPSRWYETGPLTVYEAMAAGVPPIVSARAGAAEKVVHGETGLVVQPNVEALAAAFRRVATNGTARCLGRVAYERYWDAPLDGAAHARAITAVYQDVLAPRHRLAA